ncbi:obscurin isoform X5 [Gadus macrocephalus]|uniref:obscurin isoform X5 n=1 Tax=Gadus macrocephalus TaxID=80720 RepID=UPI0028CB6F7B|nr:obscurin isoform X5 [Gadus macrocephalus]
MDVFGGAPRFLAYPRPVVVQSGTDAVLKCQIGGDPRPAVIWESNNIKIDTQGRYRVFEDGNVYNLIISSVTSEDSGQYICKAKNSIGETYAAATLKVEGEAQELEVREENKPRFLIKPLSTRVGRGDDAVFSCKLWGNPRPDVVWEKDGRKLHEIFESTHFSVGCQDGGWFQLKIFKTRAPDGGVYTCKARNEFGEGLAGAVLLVDAGPGQGDDGNRNGYNNSHWKAQQGKQRSGRLMSNRLRDDGMTKSTKVKMFAVTEGKHAKFRCFVTGKPKPEIIWRKDGRLILSGRRYLCYEDREGYFTLKVLYCKQKDNGVYVCAASNTAGQTLSAVHLTVKEPPVRFKQPLIDLEVWERDLAVLECEVPEDSVPITWYLEDRRLQPGAKYGMEEWGTKRRLTIRDIGVDDDGIYLCEMPDGGRSIAEVAVKGTIVRKLPRKVDVLEGENAAFCVEVEEEEMDIHWYKEGVELRETHQTILKSFGRTHILVFVNTNPQDSGLVMFFVGRSKTSSQLRVKAAKHSPPSCPVSVQINTERANAALLSWVPAQDSRKNPPSGYVLERQEVGTGSQEWLQCLTTDSATSVEILGDSVPCEADYRFRICSVNKYGKSNNVEFPRAVHLVPVARIQAPLQDALVPEGQDACFTIELSASVIGTWFLNGTQLQDDERYTTRRSRTHQSLRIRGVRETDNGAEITFIAYGIRDSAALYIQAPLVKFSPLSEMDRNKFIEEGNPIVLYCELSDPAAPVHWYKNGVELQTTEGLHIQSEGTMRRIVIQSAEFSHSGVYCCDAIDDVIRFNVEVEAPPVKFTPLPDEKRERAIHTGSRMELQCELSDLSATVHWYKDGSKLLPQSGVEMLSDGLSRMLVVDVADFIHSGLYSCKTKGDAITFNVDVTVPPVKFSAIPEQLRNKTIEAGCPIVLQCVVSDPEAQVCWYKGPTQLLSNAELEIQSEGHTRSLVIQFAEPGHSGVYSCASEDDTMEFRVEIRAIPVKFSTSFDVEQTKAFEVGAAFELECEVTEPTAEVCWYKDGHQLCPQNGWDINSDSSFRRLIVQSAELFHAGRYSCETSDDTIQFTVEVKAPMLPLSSSPEVEESNLIEVTCPLELQGQWSDSAVPVLGPQDEEQDQTSQPGFETGGFEQTLVIEPTHSSKSGAYYCATEDDVAKLIVQNEALPVTCPPGSAVEKTKPIEAQSPIVRQFEISDPVAKACWYKDGTQIYPQNNSQSETAKQTMFLPSDGLSCEKKSGCERKAEVQFNVDKKAYQCHSGDDSVAVSDESHESTMDTKAIPPRHSPDQATEPRKSIEVANSTEDETILQKPNSWVSRKIGEPCKYIKHSGPTPALNPTSQGYDEQIPVCSEVPSSSRQATTVDDVDCLESTYAVMVGSGANQHCIQTTEVQIENLRRNTQYSPAPLENVTTSTHTVTVQAHKYCAALQTATVQAEEPGSAQECTAFKSQEICKSSKMKNIQSKKLCRSSKTEKLQSVGLSKCFQAETIQSEGVSRGLQAEKRQSHGLSSCLQAETIQSVGLSQCLAAETIQSQGLSSCLQVETVESVGVSSCFETESHQLVEQSSCLQAETVQSVGLSSCSKTEGHKSVELSGSLQTQTIQEKENSKQIATVLSDGLSGCLQTKTLQLNDPCDSIKSATVQSEEVSNSFSSTVQSGELRNSSKTAIISQLDELSDSLQSVTAQSVDLWDSSQSVKAQSKELGNIRQMATVLSVKLFDSSQPNILQTVGAGINISENGSLQIGVLRSSPEVISLQPQVIHSPLKAMTVMPGKEFDLLHSTTIQSKDVLHNTREAVPIPMEESYYNMQLTAIQTGGNTLETEGDALHCLVYSKQRANVYSLESYKAKPVSALQSEEVYLSRACDSQWDDDGDDDIALKVDVEAPPVRIKAAVCETERNQSCEVSDPCAGVSWYKDGLKLLDLNGQAMGGSEGSVRSLSVESALPYHAAPPVKFSAMSEADQTQTVMVGCPIALLCELSDPTGQVHWSKDGAKLIPPSGVDIQSDGNIRKLTIQSAQRSHSGVYQCETKDDAIQFSVDVKALPLKFCELPEDERSKSVKEGSPLVLRCELCQDTTAEVFWSRDGTQLLPGDIDIQSDGLVKKLCIHSVDRTHAGVYQCSTAGDSITFTVEIKGCSQRIKPIPMSEKFKALSVGSPVVLQCELQDPVAQVSWCKDGVELYSKTGLDMKRNGHVRKLVINSAKASDSGLYSCCLSLDVVTFQVEVQDPAAEVNRYKDVVQPLPLSNFDVQSNDELRSMNIQSAEARHRGLYSCEAMNDIHIESKVDVAVHPVTFVNSPEEERFKSVVEQDQLVLACEVSQADAPVQWYMDGVELQACDNVTMRSADTARTLSIRSARLSDTGTYTCRAGDSALIFKVNIREPPVTIVYPKEDVHLDRHVPEEIILSCELSRPNGVVNWYKDGQKLQESENIKLKVEGPYRRLKLICSRVEDSGEYVCDTADDSIFFHLKITEPPVRIVSPSQSQMELCQQTSERMVLSCEISRANALVRWYRDGLEVEENKNLILEVDGIYRRLIIPETSVQDSAEYVCDTADDSVTFFVNIAEPPVRFMRPRKMASVVERFAGEAMVLDCEVSRANAEVTWKRNGEEVEDSRKVTILEDVVLRQLTVHCLSLEDAGQYVCDAKDDVMDFQVKVKELPVRILGKTDATAEKKFLVSDDIILVCELSRANASVSWYKDSVLIDNDTRVCCEEQGAFRSLVVLSAELEDSGEYSCDAGDDKMLFCITVKEPPVQIIGNSGTPEQHILVAGDDLILECEVSRPNCPVQWLWNSKLLKSEDRIKIDSCDVVRRLVLSGLQPSDSGKYICDAIDDKMITLVEVQQPPVKFVNKQPNNNISACENECVSLCAIVSQERANVRWLKDGRLLNEDNVHISIDGANHNLTINPLKLSNAGVYVCDANTDEMSFTVIVKEIKATFSLPLENITGLKGSMLTLRCELSKPKGDVQWLKNGQEISPSRRHTIRAQGRERSFAIHQLADEDAGEYTCESTDDRTSTVVTVETPRTVEFIAELHNITVREGEDATFKCVVSPEDTHLTWCLNGERVHQDDRLTVISNGLCHTFCIKKCRVSDSARVTADAEGLAVSQANLQVQEQQVLFTKSMAPLTAEEFGEATLEVEVSLDSGEVQWMRQGVLLHPGAKYSLKRKGRKHTLTVHKLAVADRGIYSCESLHDRTQAQLTVEPRKVTINTGLKDIWTTERETASFEVVLSHADVPGSWLRNGVQLKPTKHWRISTKGHVHSLTVSNLAVEDTGSFSFCVENLRTSARLVVREPPVTFLRHLEDQKFPEGSVVSIECELSRHNVDVRWMKNGAEVKPGKDQRIFAMGRKRFLQIMKGVVGDSAQYTCDAADTSTSCTIEIYEREVLVVQGLQDQDIQEDQNAVFVCDLSVEDVPGEWYRNGDRIQPTSSIKIRQEGTKHFLLMVNVRGEDSGEIKFVARHVESVASLKVEELPVNIVNPLQDQTVVERSRVLLDCTVSNPRCSIRWYKGPTVILPSERFEICSEGCYRKLIIQPVELRDQGTYSVQVGEYSCSAHLTVEAQSVVMVRPLEDVEVGAPGDACFQCEISHPVLRAPVWSLRGEQLQPSATVFLEKMGPIHRLTLRETAPDMSGEVGFTLGPACSTAKLTVRQVIPD